MSLIKSRNRKGELIPTFPSMRSLFDNWGLDDDFFSSFWNGKNMPAVNIAETDETFEVELAVPGMDKEDFKIEIDNGRLTISAEKEDSVEEKQKNYQRKEYSFQSFQRSFWLPENVNQEDVKANYQKGVLTITLEKEPIEEGKKVEVKVN